METTAVVPEQTVTKYSDNLYSPCIVKTSVSDLVQQHLTHGNIQVPDVLNLVQWHPAATDRDIPVFPMPCCYQALHF
jgi:hypothetical protein